MFVLSLCSNMLTLESKFEYMRQKLKNMLILKFHPGMKCLHVFFSFFILGWNFIPVFLTEMSSSRYEILSQQKRVNSKKHFTIDMVGFVPGRVSSRDEISRVNTLRVAPFVEHLRNEKKSIIKLQKKKIKWYFCRWFLFLIQGVKFKHFENLFK